ncbi:collagen alpha-1(I) chain-like [Eschrichtius robustus]|uniref:collagen alpha-1(I) chain-like n=1 Tax=Eschrichtius robustus TaxID=9764 RepID=UPI0035C1ABB2
MPAESPPDGTFSCAYPTLRGRPPDGGGPRTPVGGGAPSPPGTPDCAGWGRGAAAALRIRVRGRRAQRRGEPAPRGRPEARRAAAAGSPSARPDPPAVDAEPRGRPGLPGSAASSGRSCAPAASPGRARRPLVAGARSEQRLAARRRSPKGRTFVSARRLLSPPSVNHSWSPGEEGRPGDARPFKGAARLFGAPASSPRLGAGPARHQRIASSEGTRSWLYFTIVLLPAGPLVSKMSFRASFAIPWVCLQIWPVLGVVAFKINTHQRLILSDNSSPSFDVYKSGK